MATLRPPLDRLDQLVDPLTDAELQVAEALETLDDGWTIFVQPRIGLSQPDFIALHDQRGVCAIEVAEWQSDSARQAAGGVVEVLSDERWHPATERPRFEASRTRALIHDQYFAHPGDDAEPTDLVRAIVVAPGLTDHEAVTLMSHPWVTEAERAVAVWGGEALTERLDQIVGATSATSDGPASLDRLRSHIVASELATTSTPAALSLDAKKIASNVRASRIRRVRGPAGSGKSFGLTARAARLAGEGRKVLVLTFNITLANRLRGLVDQRCAEYGANPTLVSCANFHSFCTRVVQDAALVGIETTAPDGMRWPDAILWKAQQAFAAGYSRRYDAVLIDEGQDFAAEWWELLRTHVLAPDGEMLVVVDPTQQIYENSGWLDDDERAIAAGFEDPWIELAGSYRMPSDLVPVAEHFVRAQLGLDPLPATVDDDPCVLLFDGGSVRRWHTVERVTDVGQQIGREVVRLLRTNDDLEPRDVVFLCEYHHDGVTAVAEIESAGYPVHHIFSRDPDDVRRRRKYRFWPDAAGVKGCTVHNFKGWDARAVVVGIGVEERSKRLAYVAMTRIRRGHPGEMSYLTVVNADPRLAKARASFEGLEEEEDTASDDILASEYRPFL